MKNTGKSVTDTWDKIRRSNMCTIEVAVGEERENLNRYYTRISQIQ